MNLRRQILYCVSQMNCSTSSLSMRSKSKAKRLASSSPLFTLPASLRLSMLAELLKGRLTSRLTKLPWLAVRPVSDPEGGTPYYTVEELEGAEREIEMVAEALRVRPIRGSKSDIVSALRRHSYVHIACHGNLNPEDPMQSGLVLGNEVLTVRELLESSIDCHIVVLSACHSAFVSPEPGDPFVSLSAAFLYAGAHHVVAAQWAVSDEITTSLISRFYEEFHALEPSTHSESLRLYRPLRIPSRRSRLSRTTGHPSACLAVAISSSNLEAPQMQLRSLTVTTRNQCPHRSSPGNWTRPCPWVVRKKREAPVAVTVMILWRWAPR